MLEHILEVSIDLSGNYRSFVNKYLPNADIVADRFHIMKLVNDELNRTRNQLKREANAAPDTPENKVVRQALKQSKYALLKPEDNLTEVQQNKLNEIRDASPKLAEMHGLKEQFRTIFETASKCRAIACKSA
ncbi:hypothetical protein XM38_031060 [Halomicronema hongdechloris C2206]|uniref:Transposase IS204/IS1001/IS1096/IS1165 DDE domain-containing protein n=1 Tax=Halomicronema hongdechloris C2206 TaxID=1641165 RepID=A0A1Z3HPG6_9CYAN|nr:hypothetical protein XM38_031060 [Halomicronema hongdechloris C2206]